MSRGCSAQRSQRPAAWAGFDRPHAVGTVPGSGHQGFQYGNHWGDVEIQLWRTGLVELVEQTC